ncbi:hypothetical protein ACXZEG_005128 [Escherichia coli]
MRGLMNDKIVASIAEYLKEQEARLLDPSEVCSPGFVWPDFDDIDRALLFAIQHDPAAAMQHGLLCPVVNLLSYGNGKPRSGSVMDKVKDWAYASRYGHLFMKTRSGFDLLPTTTIVALNKQLWPYTGWAINGVDTFDTDEERAKGSILLQTLIGFIPGLELPRAWSKMFDAERNMRGKGLQPYGGCRGKPYLWVDSKDGKVVCGALGQFNNNLTNIEPVNHVVDHLYGNTATLQPGFRATLQLRTMYRDVNDSNKHPDSAIGDFLCWGDFTGYQPSAPFQCWDDLIKAGWVHMMSQALAIQPVGGFHLEDTSRWCLALSQ